MSKHVATNNSVASHRVAVIGGDGIGPEVLAEALKVVGATGVKLATTNFDLGGARYLRDGEVLSDATLASCASLMRFCLALSARQVCHRALSSAACC